MILPFWSALGLQCAWVLTSAMAVNRLMAADPWGIRLLILTIVLLTGEAYVIREFLL